MKQILMSELKQGDIFTEKIQPHNRKAFEVIEMPKAENKTIKCRQTGMVIPINKTKKGYVVLLKNIKGNIQNQTL